jgi:hypothetical protein
VVLLLATGWASVVKFIVDWFGAVIFVVDIVAGQKTNRIPIVNERTMVAPAIRFHISSFKIFTMK